MNDYAVLHEPYAALVRVALRQASPEGAVVALDLAAGDGHKTTWLASVAQPGAWVLALDHDRTQIACRKSSGVAYLVADAHHLPLGTAQVDLIWCIAALHLFADRAGVLDEIQRTLRPRGTVVLAVAGDYWIRRRTWPAGSVPSAMQPPEPADDLGGTLRRTVEERGFADVRIAAYLLEAADQAIEVAWMPLVDAATVQLKTVSGATGVPGLPVNIGEPEIAAVLLIVSGRKRAG
ncbi:class I SAM-dependent methyltransferase [Candidatus Chloroploca sp. Khr17]|uniref:class I SAM-dependent methyltransferase n=1 Tax=Candidatus Chloroploca sp. Khr17 TaxID=2496869 RepID=UPI00101D1ACF|nr:class I SAM-dependent methyltransferase [Candidatus Chloroploca sp. Khr17]